MNENVVPFNFLAEVQKSTNINALFPDREIFRAILWLYAKINDSTYAKGQFREQDILTAFTETAPQESPKMQQDRLNSVIGTLQEYYLRYDDDEQVYTLKVFAKNLCQEVERALEGNFNPTQIEIICTELKAKLLACEDEKTLTNWLELNFNAFEPRMNGQVDNLDRKIDTAVAEIRESAQLQEGNVLETLKKIDTLLEGIRKYNNELRVAFTAMKEINTELDNRLMEVDSSNLLLVDLLTQAREFFPGVKYRLDLIDKRLDRLHPRLRQFFGALNKPRFNTDVERFLRFILKNSTVESGTKKRICLPDNIPSFRVTPKKSHFIVVERREELFPAMARKVKTDEQTPEEKRESYEVLGRKVAQQDKITQWVDKICLDCRNAGSIDFADYFFQMVQEEKEDIELASKVANRLLKIAALDDHYTIYINNEITVTLNNISIWEMKIHYR
ncbi:hypothetical protein GFS24_17645 [Chitinophaga sp. SYP-B3965]|uniref:hypothetical protein n=1 Tax=Chitinophaga sp. SYP-B3965 TaxID=2663120 RepID=UPI00129956DE|nr:hypothetical protein [Chitinophaga sp. SYP-B3965]MRG46950.1 hypothetical protein [Chitinophaga sp. SYP-B3965]